MTTVLLILVVALGLMAIAGWMFLISWMVVQAIDADETRSVVVWYAGAAWVFAVPVAAVIVFAVHDDPRPNELCAAGHQQWQTASTLIPVGKVFIPTTTSEKVWVCDRWENGR